MLAERVADGHHVARADMQQAVTALAHASPELGFLLMASALGKSTLSLIESNLDVETDRLVKKWLGITYQTETHTKTHQVTRRRDVTLY